MTNRPHPPSSLAFRALDPNSNSLDASRAQVAGSETRAQADESQVYRFCDEERSISIFNPNLPAPWINYLSNGSLSAFVSHTGGGCLWWRSPINFRITRYRGWTHPTDSPGFYLYVREPDGTYWSPSYRPCEIPLDEWTATHSPGISAFFGRHGKIKVTQKLFVAPDSDVLVWDMEVTNEGKDSVGLDLFGYVELGLLEYPIESSWGYYVRHQFKTWFDPASQAQLYLFHHESHPRLADVPLVYFASDRKIKSYSGDRQTFLGPGRTERNPQGVERGHCGNGSLWGGDPCAALQVRVDVAPGETERLSFFLGVIPGAIDGFEASMQRLSEEVARNRAPRFIAEQKIKHFNWWNKHLNAFDCKLPDADIERQIVTWTPVNCVHTGRYSRSFSQFASGLRGFGFRDTAQDMLAIATRQPDWARTEFLRLLNYQFADGHAVHTYYPEDNQEPARSIHSDDHLWLPMLAYALVAETGNLQLLAERTSFLAEDGISKAATVTVWEHLLAALNFTHLHLGTHCIPLTLKSDWNDCIGRFARGGKGESVMVAQQYIFVLRQMLELAAAYGDKTAAAILTERLEAQLSAVQNHCWDGDWWVRGFEDDASPIGSKSCKHGQIWLNSQTWSVLANCGSQAEQTAAMDSVARILNTPCGIKKLHPSFPTFPEVADAFSGYSLGCGENGAIFCHANAWAVIAECLLKRPERAWKYFRQLLPHPALQKTGLERYQSEPYAYASSIIGPENPHFGLATLTHMTGTAAWMDIAGTQYLLGVRPQLDGLKLAPCLPKEWQGFSATRLYRGCRLEIKVCKPTGSETGGVSALRLDGERHVGNTLRPEWITKKKSVHVELEWAK
ncbi:MAG: GH36-type glycosyl hydrolase domain-containing protein [Chthoniobacteraceae bacterium]